MWSEQQKKYLNLLEIPIWVSREAGTDVETTASISRDNLAANASEKPVIAQQPITVEKNNHVETVQTSNTKSDSPQVSDTIKEIVDVKSEVKAEVETDTSDQDSVIEAKPLACLVFKTPSFLLVIEQTWNQIQLTKAEQVFLTDMLRALYQDPKDAFDSANSFQWPPTNNEMFLVEDSMLAFNEYFSEFPQPLFIIFGEHLHQALDEQVELWNLSEIADTQVMNLPPLASFIGNSPFKKRLWKNFLAPLAPAFK